VSTLIFLVPDAELYQEGYILGLPTDLVRCTHFSTRIHEAQLPSLHVLLPIQMRPDDE
jgi:hypothetical protein